MVSLRRVLLFLDYYLDIPFDLSNVLFITTANQLDTIPGPLLDRMELIRLSGYITQEKVEIAKKYLVPKQLDTHGFNKNEISFTKAALKCIIDHYAREAGVRNLEKHIRKVIRKISLMLAEIGEADMKVDAEDIIRYLGKPIFTDGKETFESDTIMYNFKSKRGRIKKCAHPGF